MKKFIVKVKEISYGTMEITAESKEAAESLAAYNYDRGFTDWTGGEYELDISEAPKDLGDAR